jgi:hypothetical protein
MKLEGRAGSGAAFCSGLGFDAVIGFARSAAQSTILIAGGENQKPPRSGAGVQFEFTAVAKARQAMTFAQGKHFLPTSS